MTPPLPIACRVPSHAGQERSAARKVRPASLQRPPQLPAQLPAQLRALVCRRYPHSGARARHSTVDVEAGVDHLEAHLRRLSSEKLPPVSFDAPVSTEPSLASAILAASTGGAGLLSPSSLRSRAYPDLRPLERGALPEDDVAATTPLVAGREATASSAPREGGPPPRSATERRAATERPKGGVTAKRFRRRAPSPPPPGVPLPPDTVAPPQWIALALSGSRTKRRRCAASTRRRAAGAPAAGPSMPEARTKSRRAKFQTGSPGRAAQPPGSSVRASEPTWDDPPEWAARPEVPPPLLI